MAALATRLQNLFAASVSINRGATAPTAPFEGMLWWDTDGAPVEVLKRYTVVAGWVEIVSVNVTTGAALFVLADPTITSPKINENVALTATSTELNQLDGVTLGTAAVANVATSQLDTTANVLIRFADFGLGRAISLTAGTDLDDSTYRSYSALYSIATGSYNGAPISAAAYLIVLSGATGGVQIYITRAATPTRAFVRTFNVSWNAWREIDTSALT
jgi:hypothetical protein